MIKYIKILILSILITQNLSAQDVILEDYIKIGLESNLALQQKNFDWQKSILILQESKSLFFPDISFNARYTVADGGRIIEFPVGDMLNGVYSTLNSLTGSSAFPEVENMEFPFLRPTEHETKLRLVQPIFNTNIFYNKKIKQSLVDVSESDLESYRLELIAEIKTAYYEYLKTLEIKNLLMETRLLLEENLRVSKSLFENDKVTRDVVLRSESEILKLNAQIQEIEKGIVISSAYFNFLLNRNLDEEILISEPGEVMIPEDLEAAIGAGIANRKEMQLIEAYQDLAQNQLDMNKSSRYPNMYAVVDYGFQGEKYQFTNNDDYLLASIVLQWDLFKGFQNRSKISQSRIDMEKISRQKEETLKLIEFDIRNAWYNFLSCRKSLEAAKNKNELEKETYRIVEKKYNQGMSAQLEYLNARNAMTAAGQDLIIEKFNLMIAYANFEKAIGGIKTEEHE